MIYEFEALNGTAENPLQGFGQAQGEDWSALNNILIPKITNVTNVE